MHRIDSHIATAAALALVLALVAREARSEPPPPDDRARALYAEAVAALNAGDPARACPMLEEVMELVPEAIGARISLAECYEEAGRLASAWRTYTAAERVAAEAGQAARRDKARARAEALAPRLSRLTIAVTDAAAALPAFQVWLDGAPLPAERWGAPLPVDKGEHVVSATAVGRRPMEKVIVVDADGRESGVAIEELPREKSAPWAAPPPGRARARAGRERPRAVAVARAARAPGAEGDQGAAFQRDLRIAGLLVGGLGLAGAAAGATAGVAAIVWRDKSNDGHCEGNRCDAVGLALRKESRRAGDLATGLLLGGAGALGVGVALVIAGSQGSAEPRAAAVVAPRGVALRGAW